MELYSLSDVEKLIDYYLSKDGSMETYEEGSLGYGTLILEAPGCRTSVVQEVFLNEWSSAHTIRTYNKTPKKYMQL